MFILFIEKYFGYYRVFPENGSPSYMTMYCILCTTLLKVEFTFLTYSQFHKTLPIASLQMHWISVRFYEMGDSCGFFLPPAT